MMKRMGEPMGVGSSAGDVTAGRGQEGDRLGVTSAPGGHRRSPIPSRANQRSTRPVVTSMGWAGPCQLLRTARPGMFRHVQTAIFPSFFHFYFINININININIDIDTRTFILIHLEL